MRIEGSKSQISQRTHQHYEFPFVGDGVTVDFFLPKTIAKLSDVTVTVAGLRKRVADRGVAHDYSVRGLTPGFVGDRNSIRFAAAPAGAADILITVVST